MTEKESALEAVEQEYVAYRQAQQEALDARERFIDAIVAAKEAKATQREIADCTNAHGDEPLSRQRIAQFIDERRKSIV